MKETEYLKEKNELVDIVHCAFNDWDDYNDDCYFEHISPIESVEDFVADAVLHADYRKQEWISVEERLPEEKVMVLGFYHRVFKGGGHNDLVLVMELQNGLFVPFNCSPVKNGSVTHWMPLPEPPKGE